MIDLSWDRNNAVNWDWVEPLALGLLFMFVLPGGGWTTDCPALSQSIIYMARVGRSVKESVIGSSQLN